MRDVILSRSHWTGLRINSAEAKNLSQRMTEREILRLGLLRNKRLGTSSSLREEGEAELSCLALEPPEFTVT